jgi:lysophospholipase L1-like esterase
MSIFRKLLFSAIAVALFFGLLEGGLRLLYRPYRPFRFYAPHSESIVERDPDLGYRLRSHVKAKAYATLVETNSFGFRGPEFNRLKTGPRLIALGDSCTFGFGVSDNDHTYPAALSRLIREAHRTAEVINAGVVGYTSHQGLQLLRNKIVDLHPDVVLIYIGWNDFGNSLLPDWTPSMTQDVAVSHIWGSSPPYIFLALNDLLSPLRRSGKIGFKPEAVSWYAQNLRGIVEAARSNGIKPVLLTWPTRVQRQIEELKSREIMLGTGVTFASWFSYYKKYQQEIETVAREQNVQIIQLAERFNQLDESFYFDEIHLNDRGALEAAKLIWESLQSSESL